MRALCAQTPRAPPIPVAAALSPILWQLNNPDRFDMYSAGVMLLQAAMPALRSDSALIAFRRKLEQCNYDLRAWRAQQVCAHHLSCSMGSQWRSLELERNPHCSVPQREERAGSAEKQSLQLV